MDTNQRAKNYAYTLADKVHKVRGTIENERSAGRPATFDKVKEKGEPYFKDHELRALESVGGIEEVLRYSEINILQNKIEELYLRRSESKSKENEQSPTNTTHKG